MKDCKLIATIPAMTDIKKVHKIIGNKFISGVRWNTGIVSPYTVDVTLDILKEITNQYKKELWVDIKGRQLRVEEWGNPLYSSIVLNHEIITNGVCHVKLRGEDYLDLVSSNGSEIFVNPLPSHAVGKGQSVNILGDVEIKGYLTSKDKEYLNYCSEKGILNIMGSFVEEVSDINSILSYNSNFKVICKIESKKGIQNLNLLKGLSLMAARDDMYIELRDYRDMNYGLHKIITHDKDAICASRIFTSLEHSSTISYSDFMDMEQMYLLGYRNFMLCDNVCNYCFDKAILGWELFLNG